MDDIKAILENLLEDIRHNKEKKIKRKINDRHIKINFNLDLGKKDDGYYISMVDIPTYVTRLPSQLKSEILKLYLKLVKSIEGYLSKKYQVKSIYEKIYILASYYIQDAYDPNFNSSLVNLYENLAYYIDKQSIISLKNTANFRLDNLPAANEQTRIFYNLTENGKEKVFFDLDGKLRAKYEFTREEERAINQLSQRKNILWENDRLKNLTVNIFLMTLKEAFINNKIKIELITVYTKPYTISKKILDSILVITESNVRDRFSFLSNIKLEKYLDVFKDNELDDLYDFINEYQNEKLDSFNQDEIIDIYMDFFKDNPNKTKDISKFLGSIDLDKKMGYLLKFKSNDNFYNILNDLTNDDFPPNRLFAYYYIFRENKESKKDIKAIEKFVRAENMDLFHKLINNNDFSLDLVKKILELKNLQIKKIKLDDKKIEKSRSDLISTVNTINEYLREDISLDITDAKNKQQLDREILDKKDNTISPVSKQIIKEILANGYISLDKVSNIAITIGKFLNVLIADINKELYDYVNDQVLIIDDDKLIIDKFYVDMIKELF